MKKTNRIGRWMLLLLSAVLLPLQVHAVNSTNSTLSIEAFTMKTGETKAMLIDLNNPSQEVTMVEFYMYLPTGLSVAEEDGELAIDIAGRTTLKKHSLETKQTSNGVIHVLLYSGKNTLINGTSGALLSISLTASSTFSGGDIQLKQQLMTSPDEAKTESKPADYTYTVKIATAGSGIAFKDTKVKALCVANWDTNGDGELSESEAAAVTSLGTVFRDNEEMTSFEELQYFTSLTKLDADAFRNCAKLETLTLPDGLTEIGNNAFTNCPSLQSLHIPASLTTIGEESVFHYCTSLTAFTVDAASTSFSAEDGILYNKDKTELVCCPATKAGVLTLPSTVQTIRTSAFAMCTKLTSVKLPASLRNIRNAAFVGCSGLTTFDFTSQENTEMSMGTGCFTGCSNLTDFTVNGSKDGTIGNFMVVDGVLFWKYGYEFSLTKPALVAYPAKHGSSYVVPEGIVNIDAYAFCMTEISEVTLPTTLRWVYNNAFTYCDKLTKVTATAAIPFDTEGAFYSTDNQEMAKNVALYLPSDGMKEIYQTTPGWDKFGRYVGGSDDITVFIDESVSGQELYFKTNGQGTVTLIGAKSKNGGKMEIKPQYTHGGKTYTVTEIGSGMKNYTLAYTFDYTVFEMVTYDGFISDVTEVVIPNTVKKIGSTAFYSSKLEKLEIPGSVEEIGPWAFSDCRNLTSLKLNKGLKTIGDQAFLGLPYMESLEIPEGVTVIGDHAFNNRIKDITIPASVEYIGDNAFDSDANVHISDFDAWCRVETVPYPKNPWYPEEGTGIYVLEDGEWQPWIPPYSLGEIGWYNLYLNDKEVTEISIPEGVTTVPPVFNSIMNLEKITIPSSLEEIGIAFNHCSNLKTVVNLSKNPQLTYTIKRLVGARANTRAASDGEECVAFGGVDKDACALYVPAGSKKDYSSADGWSKFKNIKSLGDANGDGNVTPADAIMTLYHYFNVSQNGFDDTAADINGDGTISPADAVEALYIYFNSDKVQARTRQETISIDPQ